MYNNKLAMAVKVDGKVLREIYGEVFLPFGGEYSIYFRNYSKKRARIKIHIDGQDIMDGGYLIVDALSTSEITRFMKKNNLNEGNSLKFIEKTQKISDFRGDNIEDGLIRVEFEYEKECDCDCDYMVITSTDSIEKKMIPYTPYTPNTPPLSPYMPYIPNTPPRSPYMPCVPDTSPLWPYHLEDTFNKIQNVTYHNHLNCSNVMSDAQGITVPGSRNVQHFTETKWKGSDGIKRQMTIRLCGIPENSSITSITIFNKVKCQTCGETHKSGKKYCSECGTALKLY